MSCWAWPEITNSMAAAGMFAKVSDRLSKLVCGISPPTTAEDRYKAGLRALLLLPPSPETQPRRSSSSSSPSASMRSKAPEDDDDGDETAAMSPSEPCMEHDCVEDMASSTLPCLAFASEHGYRVFSLAEMRMLAGADVATMPPVIGRRLIPSPYGGTVLATDVCYKHPCHLFNPFTGERAALPDLPIPFSEKEPVRFHPDDEPPRLRGGGARVTDDGLAWDWSPLGVMVARGDTAFFCAHGGGESSEWTPVHQSARGSPMTVNYRGGRFFLLELRTLATTVIDAATLCARAEIPPPAGLWRGGDLDAAYLAPDDDDAVLIVHRAGDTRGLLLTEAYRARDSKGSPRWSRVRDIGGRAVFVDGAHAFTVAADPAAGAMANCMYVIVCNRVARPCGGLAVVYDVAYSELARPDRARRLMINADEVVVDPMWGHPHWIIRRRDGSGRRRA